mmetsp:Transcript_4661/g.8955  ORF Transcript_4661/g.8955 Transcript_4661/m.8955 type:complete len:202 (-) Transcript_4661:1991-2596(-)
MPLLPVSWNHDLTGYFCAAPFNAVFHTPAEMIDVTRSREVELHESWRCTAGAACLGSSDQNQSARGARVETHLLTRRRGTLHYFHHPTNADLDERSHVHHIERRRKRQVVNIIQTGNVAGALADHVVVAVDFVEPDTRFPCFASWPRLIGRKRHNSDPFRHGIKPIVSAKRSPSAIRSSLKFAIESLLAQSVEGVRTQTVR